MGTGSSITEKHLTQVDHALLAKISADLGIVADLCRADILLYTLKGGGQVRVYAQARPHSSAPLYQSDRVGTVEPEEVLGGFGGAFWRPFRLKTMDLRGATVARQILPVCNQEGRLIAMLARDATWFAHERHRRRAKAFQRALLEFLWMVVHGRLPDTSGLSPFREHDGIMYVDAQGDIRYLSGICAEIYRGLGYRDSLVGRRISDLETVDAHMVQEAVTEGRALERSVEEAGGLYIRKVIPIVSQNLSLKARLWRSLSHKPDAHWRPRGAFLLLHDATEAVKTQRELESQMAIVREVHHRVKNNLQVIASIMRMEARRAQLEETREALEDAVQRIMSVAVVHEFLSQQAEGTTINLKDVTERIIGQVQASLLPPDKDIEVSFTGPDIWLPAERATQCALIINELVQNAIEHGMAEKSQGRIAVKLVDEGGSVRMIVEDDGQGLGEGFELETQANLGLTLVQSMVVRDLRGRFTLESASQGGTRATVVFDK